MIATLFLWGLGAVFVWLARGEDMPKAKTVLQIAGIGLIGVGLFALGVA